LEIALENERTVLRHELTDVFTKKYDENTAKQQAEYQKFKDLSA
jgi:hypothetical protein